MAVHLLHLRNQYEKKGLDKLYAYTSVALVRYIDLTNIDKPFYEAGMAAKKVVSKLEAFLIKKGLGGNRLQHAQQVPGHLRNDRGGSG